MPRPVASIVPRSSLAVSSAREFYVAAALIPTLNPFDYRLWQIISGLSIFDELEASARELADLLSCHCRVVENSLANLRDHGILSAWERLSTRRMGYRILLNLTSWKDMPKSADDLPEPSTRKKSLTLGARQSRTRFAATVRDVFLRLTSAPGSGPLPEADRSRKRTPSAPGSGDLRSRERTLTLKAEEPEEGEKGEAAVPAADPPPTPPAPPVSQDPDPDPRALHTAELSEAWNSARRDLLGIPGPDPAIGEALPGIVAYCAGDPVRVAQVGRMFRWLLTHDRLKGYAGSLKWVAGRIDQLHPQACGADERVKGARPAAPVEDARRARQAELAPVMDHLKRVLLVANRAEEARAAIEHVRTLDTAAAVAYAQALIQEVSAGTTPVRGN